MGIYSKQNLYTERRTNQMIDEQANKQNVLFAIIDYDVTIFMISYDLLMVEFFTALDVVPGTNTVSLFSVYVSMFAI